MGYLSCKAQSSVVTCRSLSATATSSSSSSHPPLPPHSKAAATATVTATSTETAEDGSGRSWAHRQNRIRHFSYRELEAATSNFSEQALLGRGSHGSVYRAVLRPSGHLVAVKRPSRLHHDHDHRHRGGGTAGRGRGGSSRRLERNEVENEIDILSRIHDPRLVNLVGVSTLHDGGGSGRGIDDASPSSSSFRRGERLLVVEYMPNGTLYDLLHSNPRPPGWSRRLRLALHTAKAIHALHSCDPPVVHRDVKSANVLLDAHFNAHLGDFGLALRIAAVGGGDDDGGGGGLSFASFSARSTPPAGTLGYLDPGYVTPENLSTKTDVFSFGILLLEIISGRKAIDVAHSPPSVVEWASPLLRRGKVLALYDPRTPPPKDPAALRQLAYLAASCVRSCREQRPSMEEVVDRLKALGKTLPSKSWTAGLSVGNPCLMVETAEKAHHPKPDQTELNGHPDSSTVTTQKGPEDESDGDVNGEIPASMKKPPPSSAKAVHPLRNARRRVFSEGGPSGSSTGGSSCGRNLMDLMMAPDEETLKVIGRCHQRSIISRSMTLRPARNYNERDGILQLRRNQSVREGFDVFPGVEAVGDLDGRTGRVYAASEPL